MGRHEGGEPEAGGGDAADEGQGVGRGLVVAAGRRRLEAKFPGQPAEPDDGEFAGHFSLEGADAGSQGAQGINIGSSSFYRRLVGGFVSVQCRWTPPAANPVYTGFRR